MANQDTDAHVAAGSDAIKRDKKRLELKSTSVFQKQQSSAQLSARLFQDLQIVEKVTLIEKASPVISHQINLVYMCSCWQPLINQLLQIRDIKVVEGLPESLCDDSLLPPDETNLLVIPDLMKDAAMTWKSKTSSPEI